MQDMTLRSRFTLAMLFVTASGILLISCESVLEAYGSFGCVGISRLIAMRSAEAEVARLLSSRSGIDAI